MNQDAIEQFIIFGVVVLNDKGEVVELDEEYDNLNKVYDYTEESEG